jgi:hypothetical protein
MSEQEMSQKIDDIKELLVKIENYIKVTDYEGYRQVNKLLESIDYFSLDYLRKAENFKLKEQLNNDCHMMVRARIKDDFREFCRYASLQVELLLDEFIIKMENSGRIKVTERIYDNKKISKIKKSDNNQEDNNQEILVETIQQKIDYVLMEINKINRYKNVSLVFQVRNFASHRDTARLHY